MCTFNAKNGVASQDPNEDGSDSDSSDVSITDSSGEENTTNIDDDADSVDNDDTLETTQDVEEEEEEEDPLLVAIRNECEKQRDHPPPIICEDFIQSICFHPHNDLLAVASIVGDVYLYKYTNDENTLLSTVEVHTKACRDIQFSENGEIIFSCGKDKAIMLTDVESQKLIRFFEDAHPSPVNCLRPINNNILASGDDDGAVKLWDLRQKHDRAIFSIKKNEDYISDIITNENEQYLLFSSGDGSLTSVDLRTRHFHMQSEEYDEELTCLGLFRSESKLLAGSSKGKLFLYNWNEFGLHSDVFPGPKLIINDMIPITENIVITACEDGNLRATHLFPHRHLGIAGQHDFSVENVDICNDGRFIASSSHNNDIKFWNIKYFEDFAKVSEKHNKKMKKKEMENNLPSSKRTNASDFFSGLC